jgi:hypothetical protein
MNEECHYYSECIMNEQVRESKVAGRSWVVVRLGNFIKQDSLLFCLLVSGNYFAHVTLL